MQWVCVSVFFKRKPQFQPLPDIPVRTTTDRNDPGLTGMALLSSDRLVVADRFNQSVKLVDIVQDKVLHQLAVGEYYKIMCYLPGNRAAVAMPLNNTILILDCDNQLSIVKRITVRENMLGLAYNNEHLIVLYMFGIIETFHVNGETVRRNILEMYYSGNITNHLSFMTEGNVTSIYLSDHNNLHIIRLDEGLHVHQAYPVPGYARPRRVLAVGENQLLVSTFDARLWQLDTTMGRWTCLNQEVFVDSMAFCHDRHVLYCGFGNTLKRYKIS